MQQSGFIFIPDISGFTNFVNAVELQHSRHVIQELLEIILTTNQMGLKISEVEGDAVLFYQLGEMPDLNLVSDQVERMFLSFHEHLLQYDNKRTCHCDACISAINLSLKFIAHYGEFTEYNIGNFTKLIGKDIIVAHQLLKNNIPNHEYWLLSSSLSEEKPRVFTPGMQWVYGSKQLDQSEVFFHFTQLSVLKRPPYLLTND